jgi:hypothetical protein
MVRVSWKFDVASSYSSLDESWDMDEAERPG